MSKPLTAEAMILGLQKQIAEVRGKPFRVPSLNGISPDDVSIGAMWVRSDQHKVYVNDGTQTIELYSTADPQSGISGTTISDRSITGMKLVLDTVTATEIAPLAVGTSELANAAVDGSKLNGAISYVGHIGITADAAGNQIPLKVQVPNTQTVSVFELYDAAGTRQIAASPDGRTHLGATPANQGFLTVVNGKTATDPSISVTQGGSQTGKALELRNSSGTLMAFVDFAGAGSFASVSAATLAATASSTLAAASASSLTVSGLSTLSGAVSAPGGITTASLGVGTAQVASYTLALPTTVNNCLVMGSVQSLGGGALLEVNLAADSTTAGPSKRYVIPCYYNATAGAWQSLSPSWTSGAVGTNDYALEVNISNNVINLRVRNTLGSATYNVNVTIRTTAAATSYAWVPVGTLQTAVAVPGSSYAPSQVAGSIIAAHSITGGQIAFDTVTGATGAGVGNLAPSTVNAYNLADGSVTSPKLSPGAVVAASIAAGVIDGTKIALGSLATSNLSMSNSAVSINPNGGFEDADPQGTRVAANWLTTQLAGTATATRVTSTANSGFACLKLTVPGDSTSFTSVGSDQFPVNAADVLQFSVAVKVDTVGAGHGNFYYRVHWVDAANSPISQLDFIAAFQPTTSATFTTYFFKAAVPANAVRAWVEVWNYISGTASSVYVDDVYVVKALGTTGIQDAAITNALIVNGAITTAKIGSLQVTDALIASASAGKLTAGTINVDDIYFGSGGHIYLGPDGITTFKTGQRIELNSGGVFAYDGSNNALASLTPGGFSFKSSTSGSRVILDTTGLVLYASDGVTKNFWLDDTTGNATFAGALQAATGTFGGALSGGSLAIPSTGASSRVTIDGTLGMQVWWGGVQTVNIPITGSPTLTGLTIQGNSVFAGTITSSAAIAGGSLAIPDAVSAGRVQLDSTNGLRVYAGGVLTAQLPPSGSPTMNGLTISGNSVFTGNITSSATITGGTIIGGQIASSGKLTNRDYVQMDNSGFVAIVEGTSNPIWSPSFNGGQSSGWTPTLQAGTTAVIKAFTGTLIDNFYNATGMLVDYYLNMVRATAGAGNSYYANQATAAVGQTWTASAYVMAPVGLSAQVRLDWKTTSAGADAGTVASQSYVGNGQWQRLVVTGVIPAGASNAVVVLADNGNSGKTGTISWTAAQLEQKDHATQYVDGDQPGGTWTAGAIGHQSSSRPDPFTSLTLGKPGGVDSFEGLIVGSRIQTDISGPRIVISPTVHKTGTAQEITFYGAATPDPISAADIRTQDYNSGGTGETPSQMMIIDSEGCEGGSFAGRLNQIQIQWDYISLNSYGNGGTAIIGQLVTNFPGTAALVSNYNGGVYAQNGAATAFTAMKASAFTVSSAERYKLNVADLHHPTALEKLRRLRPVSYENKWKMPHEDHHDAPTPLHEDENGTHYSLVAEEVAEVDSNITQRDLDGSMMGVNMMSLLTVTIAALKELDARVTAMA